VRIVARPGLGTNAAPIPVRLAPVPDRPNTFEGTVHLPAIGAWLLDIVAEGPSGEGHAIAPLTAIAPEAPPEWIGWALGLSPLLGVLWFGLWQRGYLQRLEASAGA
jgi:hypothetical protein